MTPPRHSCPRPATRAALQHASRIIAFGCDLHQLAPAGVAVERWDDVPAVSDGDARVRDVILGRVRTLVDEVRAPARGD